MTPRYLLITKLSENMHEGTKRDGLSENLHQGTKHDGLSEDMHQGTKHGGLSGLLCLWDIFSLGRLSLECQPTSCIHSVHVR